MAQTTSNRIPTRALSIALLLCVAALSIAQTPTALPNARGVIRLKVKVKPVTPATGLSRKRFFLIKGSLAENQSLIENMKRRPVTSRDCYYRSIGASEALIAWLKQYDCESVYCREVADWKEVDAVPEFQRAVAAGEKEFGSRELARKWLTVNLSDQIRDGYYQQQQQDLRTLIETSKAQVTTVMTDRKGTAYFTDIEPGTYVISNIIRTEGSETASLWWNCEVKVEAGDISMVMDRPYQISNTRDMKPLLLKQTKCFSDEQPLPACPAR
ncbi:MAG: hypothetical protein ACR2HX_18115 [Pyrinomonadaceae bacterium]